jgi:protein TonB
VQAALVPAPALVPLATPADTSQSWEQLRGHRDGRVLLHLDIDGQGQVSAASLIQSSGDPVLDEHALRSVRGWRFAVPADHPDGLSGELPMRYSSQGDRIARVP